MAPQMGEKLAVDCGYWHLWRSTARCARISRRKEAEELFVATQRNAQWHYVGYKKLTNRK